MLSPKKSMFCLYLRADKKTKRGREEEEEVRWKGGGGKGQKGKRGRERAGGGRNGQRIIVKVISKKERGSFLSAAKLNELVKIL